MSTLSAILMTSPGGKQLQMELPTCISSDIFNSTKGDTKPEKLGSVTVASDGKIKVDLPSEEQDLNSQYEKELAEFSRPYKPPPKTPSPEDKQEDYCSLYHVPQCDGAEC
jgi:hypothetical protein